MRSRALVGLAHLRSPGRRLRDDFCSVMECAPDGASKIEIAGVEKGLFSPPFCMQGGPNFHPRACKNGHYSTLLHTGHFLFPPSCMQEAPYFHRGACTPIFPPPFCMQGTTHFHRHAYHGGFSATLLHARKADFPPSRMQQRSRFHPSACSSMRLRRCLGGSRANLRVQIITMTIPIKRTPRPSNFGLDHTPTDTSGQQQTSIKISTGLRDTLRAIAPESNASSARIIEGLMAFHRVHNQVQFNGDGEEILIEIQALETSVFALNVATLELVEATRRVIEIKERTILDVLEQIISADVANSAILTRPTTNAGSRLRDQI